MTPKEWAERLVRLQREIEGLPSRVESLAAGELMRGVPAGVSVRVERTGSGLRARMAGADARAFARAAGARLKRVGVEEAAAAVRRSR